MSYYILPKNINKIDINPKIINSNINTYISHSLYNYYNKSIDYLQKICDEEGILDINFLLDNIIKTINPYEYIYSKVPGSNYSVSKLKPKTNLFYDIFEIFSSLNILENYNNSNIKSIIISKNHSDIDDYLQLTRENYKDDNIFHENIEMCFINNTNIPNKEKFDFIFYEKINGFMNKKNNIFNKSQDIINLLRILMLIIKYQKTNGFTIIKIDSLFDKSIIDFLYILSSLFDKVLIIKPNTSNIITFEKYIVCKNFIFSANDSKQNFLSMNNLNLLDNLYLKTENFLNMFNPFIESISDYNILQKINIKYLIQEDIPCHFINKLDEINIILGQQQLESIDNIINIIKNKNKDDKLELIKKANIQKSINWCEKYKIPYNKFIDKINIFLTNKNDEKS
jgi:hypothetical protein